MILNIEPCMYLMYVCVGRWGGGGGVERVEWSGGGGAVVRGRVV